MVAGILITVTHLAFMGAVIPATLRVSHPMKKFVMINPAHKRAVTKTIIEAPRKFSFRRPMMAPPDRVPTIPKGIFTAPGNKLTHTVLGWPNILKLIKRPNYSDMLRARVYYGAYHSLNKKKCIFFHKN